jgi:transcriptional regulator with XRE-family HTH domain
MPRTYPNLFPKAKGQLDRLGNRLREARLRRKITSGHFAERLGVSRDTLSRLERGDPAIAVGTVLRALALLGLDADVDLLAANDTLGRKLQDGQLAPRRSRRRAPSSMPAVDTPPNAGDSKEPPP